MMNNMDVQQGIQPISGEAMELSLTSENVLKITKALSSATRLRILENLRKEEMDVSGIAKVLGQTEANISAQIAILHKAGLVNCRYQPGGHGVRKICSLALDKVEISLY